MKISEPPDIAAGRSKSRGTSAGASAEEAIVPGGRTGRFLDKLIKGIARLVAIGVDFVKSYEANRNNRLRKKQDCTAYTDLVPNHVFPNLSSLDPLLLTGFGRITGLQIFIVSANHLRTGLTLKMEQNILEQILEGSMKPRNLPLEILRKITDEFSADRVIGEGGFGTVYKGVLGNWNVAVKRIKSSMTIDQKLFRREVDSLMEVNHPNIVRFLGLCSHTVEMPMKNPDSRGYIFVEIRERLLCFEYISNGSLDTKIADELRGLDWDKRYEIIKGICAGLHYLHMEKCIIHMDLKPANILLNNQMMPKITDFGLSRLAENSQTMSTSHFASPGYTAPENLFGCGRMSFKSDIYSLGVIIIELVTGRKGISDNNNNVLRRWRHRWNKSKKEMPREYHQEVIKCIEIGTLCQKINPYARPSISEIMRKILEKESMNNETDGQINLPYWGDDMLGVEPLELQFVYNKKKQILPCSVELSNDTNTFIAFMILSMNPLSYSIEPNKGIMKPRSKCSVDIKVNEGLTLSKKYTEEFIVRSIKVDEGLTTKDINQDMFDKHTASHHVDEINLVVVSESCTTKDIDEGMFDNDTVGCHVDEIQLAVVSEVSCNEEAIDFQSEHAKKQSPSSDCSSEQFATTHFDKEEPIIASPSSGARPTLIEPGSLQLLIKNSNKAPLLDYKKKVMLELTGSSSTSDRLGLDLVVVVDVSLGMSGEMKTALWFVVRKLSPIDRLSVITFSSSFAKVCPLRQITEASRRELDELIDRLEDTRSYGHSSHVSGTTETGDESRSLAKTGDNGGIHLSNDFSTQGTRSQKIRDGDSGTVAWDEKREPLVYGTMNPVRYRCGSTI